MLDLVASLGPAVTVLVIAHRQSTVRAAAHVVHLLPVTRSGCRAEAGRVFAGSVSTGRMGGRPWPGRRRPGRARSLADALLARLAPLHVPEWWVVSSAKAWR